MLMKSLCIRCQGYWTKVEWNAFSELDKKR